jgi:CoA:oxalate CoA-transferase
MAIEEPEIGGPLSGVIIVDLTRVLAGPFCTMLLSDLGARIIKVEPPGGDDSRRFGPFADGQSAYFASLNRGKESIELDLKSEDGKDILRRLLAKADVVVENFRPGTMEKLGFGWDDLHARFPKLIYAAASGFGHSGPYSTRAAYDLVAQAMGGIMSLTGQPDGEPVRVGTSIGDIAAALFTATGISSALYSRTRTGEGVKIDVAMLDSQVAILENGLARYFATGDVPGPLGTRHPSITPFEAFATADGHIVVAAGNDSLFSRLCEVLNCTALIGDPRFTTNDARTQNADALKQELESALRTRPGADWLEILGTAGIPSGPINRIDAVTQDPQVLARNMIVSADGAAGKAMKMAGNPIKMSAFDDPPDRRSVPALDADRQLILDFIDET